MTKKIIISGIILATVGISVYIWAFTTGNVHVEKFSVEIAGAGLIATTIGLTNLTIGE